MGQKGTSQNQGAGGRRRGSVRAGRSGGRPPRATSPSLDSPSSVGCSFCNRAGPAQPNAATAPTNRPTTRNSAADTSPCGLPRTCDIAPLAHMHSKVRLTTGLLARVHPCRPRIKPDCPLAHILLATNLSCRSPSLSPPPQDPKRWARGICPSTLGSGRAHRAIQVQTCAVNGRQQG